ncbi:alpha/beta fold hydrolase [Streptomyces sp. NBC_00237]|uniref:alpha/beta fold hydrolase n=1 Tax=Streptomyces sp. NBC_00237 TaxID=2975687 RepID=UPI002B1CF408|nr:alpha/beta fold hydrolase [Streptomyces sp. NBC_00237]
MTTHSTAGTEVTRTVHRFVEVDGVRVFYREAGPTDAPTLVLLHGFPSASHQFRRLIDTLGTRYHLVAPDYPGFGHTEAPEDFTYSFESLTDVMEGFVEALGLGADGFALYTFDFGGPVGMRLAARHPEWINGLIVQNANAYAEGLSDLALGLTANRPGVPGAEERVREILTLPVTRSQYEGGTGDPSLIAPDGWTLDQHFLDLPGRKEAQVALALDYHSNIDRYPVWQQWLREHRPPTLVLWGRGDAFFPEAGAHAYLRDLPEAQVHVFDTGHFALEEKLPEMAPLIAAFLDASARPTDTMSATDTTNPADVKKRTPMRIAIVGASGNLGGAVAAEAVSRGHQVTPLGRATTDVSDPTALAEAVAGHDAVVVGVKGPDHLVPRSAQALLKALPDAGVSRLVFLGGGGSLEYAPGERFVDAPGFPAAYLETARDQTEALDLLRAARTPVEWTYVSPPPMHLVPGPKTGSFRVEARDTPIADADGESRISVGDFAAAVLDTLEQGTFVQERITVGY